MVVLATVMCLSWLVFFSEMDLISTTCIIVFGFLDI